MLRNGRGFLYSVLVCPTCKSSLTRNGEVLSCSKDGRRFPILRGIPRFVESDAYVDSFSFEWNTHKTTQLDTFRNDGSSEDIFRKKTGFRPEDLDGKLVLDAGIGAGRFTDAMARSVSRIAVSSRATVRSATACAVAARTPSLKLA